MCDECCFIHLGSVHLQGLMAIEQRSFASPWSEGDFLYLFAQDSALCVGLIHAEELVGYALGYCAARDFHLASLAVALEFRRRGFASRLLQQTLLSAKLRGADRCTLEVRAANRAALLLYDKTGFRAVDVRTAHYSGPRDDGIIMERSIEIL